MKKLKIGIIGSGHLGSLHTKLTKEIINAELTGIYDIDSAKAMKVGEELGVTVHSSVDELIKSSDAVSIIATTSAHYELILKAFENKKHVFVESIIGCQHAATNGNTL